MTNYNASDLELDGSKTGLRKAIGRGGFFTLAFGAIVGSGWVVVLGDWLKVAGPGGVTTGFIAGSVVMVLVALCYGELAARFPKAGAEFLYILETLGPFAGFLVGWFLTLYAVAVCAFEGVALGWLLRNLVPGIDLGVAYWFLGSPVMRDELLVGILATTMISLLHTRGAASAIRFQNLVTCSFIVASLFAMLCGFTMGHLANIHPLYASIKPKTSVLAGVLWVFSTSSFYLNGWQAALHAIEEKRAEVSIRVAIAWIAYAIVAAALFYCGMVLSASSAMPWGELSARQLPAVAAFRELTAGGALGTLILIAAIVSLSKTWTAISWIGSRLIFALGRHGMLPKALASVDPATGAPRRAIVLMTLLTSVGIVMGRGALLPIVDMASICLALSMIVCLIVLIRRRLTHSELASFTVPGGYLTIGAALLGAACMIGIALVEPILENNGSIPVEWIFLVCWGVIAVLVWVAMKTYSRPNLR